MIGKLGAKPKISAGSLTKLKRIRNFEDKCNQLTTLCKSDFNVVLPIVKAADRERHSDFIFLAPKHQTAKVNTTIVQTFVITHTCL